MYATPRRVISGATDDPARKHPKPTNVPAADGPAPPFGRS
jgi:hypothetical protein